MPEDYLERTDVEDEKEMAFRTKILLASEMVRSQVEELLRSGVSKKLICVLVDSWYAAEELLRLVDEMGVCYMVEIRKNRKIRLFDKWIRVEEYFSSYKEERYLTDPDRSVRISYKQAILDVSKAGRCKVFSFRDENSTDYRYYITNRTKMKPKTARRYWNRRWDVETMHRSTKQYFGLKECYSGKQKTNMAHFTMVYTLFWLFSIYRAHLNRIGINVTIEELWKEYICESTYMRFDRWKTADLNAQYATCGFG